MINDFLFFCVFMSIIFVIIRINQLEIKFNKQNNDMQREIDNLYIKKQNKK